MNGNEPCWMLAPFVSEFIYILLHLFGVVNRFSNVSLVSGYWC